ECTGARQPSGTRLAEAPAAAASAMLQTRTAGRPDGLFIAVGFWSSMRPRCRANVSFALVGDLKKKSPHKARRVPLDLPGAPQGQCRVHVNAAPSGRFPAMSANAVRVTARLHTWCGRATDLRLRNSPRGN